MKDEPPKDAVAPVSAKPCKFTDIRLERGGFEPETPSNAPLIFKDEVDDAGAMRERRRVLDEGKAVYMEASSLPALLDEDDRDNDPAPLLQQKRAEYLQTIQDNSVKEMQLKKDMEALEASCQQDVKFFRTWTAPMDYANNKDWDALEAVFAHREARKQGENRPRWLRAVCPADHALGGSTVLHLLAFKVDKKERPARMDELYGTAVTLFRDFIDFKNDKGQTALHISCSNGNVALAKILLEVGASVWESTKIKGREKKKKRG